MLVRRALLLLSVVPIVTYFPTSYLQLCTLSYASEHTRTVRPQLGTIADLRNNTLRRRHWEAMERVLGHQLLDLEDGVVLTLQLLIDYGAFEHADELKEISGQASSEASLEALLNKAGGAGGCGRIGWPVRVAAGDF